MTRIGVDFGGTKIEAAALDMDGRCPVQIRVSTPADYDGALEAVAQLIRTVEAQTEMVERIGIGLPGSISPKTGLIRNANTTYLNGRPFAEDLCTKLGKAVLVQNDANCLALSEGQDGAGRDCRTVFAAVLGTGCGGGLVVDGHLVDGAHGVAGEWGHMPLPWPQGDEVFGPQCWCGRRGCLETWISGTGLRRAHRESSGKDWSCEEIVAAARDGDAASVLSLQHYLDRLARALSVIADIVDPDIIVFGGGMSNVDELYAALPDLMRPNIFSDHWDSPLRPARWGDSSGVRGAARLWETRETTGQSAQALGALRD